MFWVYVCPMYFFIRLLYLFDANSMIISLIAVEKQYQYTEDNSDTDDRFLFTASVTPVTITTCYVLIYVLFVVSAC